MEKDKLIEKFNLFVFGTEPGIGRWLSQDMHHLVSDRLAQLDQVPLTKVQLNQLLVLSRAASFSDGFFKYYWRTTPHHPYDVTTVEGYEAAWAQDGEQVIFSLDHLYWGLYRFYIDSLLFFGNVNAAFASLRSMSYDQLVVFYTSKRFDTESIAARGPALPLQDISRDDRYLISEMACKTFGELPADRDAALQVLQDAWDKHVQQGGKPIIFKDFLQQYVVDPSNSEQLLLSYDDAAMANVDSKIAIKEQFDKVVAKFLAARQKAIQNTERYLSMVNDLDVYVATSMRNRKNFRDMADACAKIFADPRLEGLHLRFFDPTLSAARGHEDKGLIECLMVKCAKVLVYCEGEKESYGKDAEAAMALSLGKPVIFFCDHGKKTGFYRDVHPLARLIEFRTGVAVGAIVSDQVDQVAQLLDRLFRNRMEYRVEHHPNRPGYLKLVERLTGSVVRLQTDDPLIEKTFWNNYRKRLPAGFPSLAAGKEAERLQE
jgi:hypothetical protein